MVKDFLALAVLAQFLIDQSQWLDVITFGIAAVALAVAVGMGGGGVLDKLLAPLALTAWLLEKTYLASSIAWAFWGLFTLLVILYLYGKFVRLTSFAIPAAILLAIVGITMFLNSIKRIFP